MHRVTYFSKSEADIDLLGSAGPTQSYIGKSVGLRNPDVVAPTTIQEKNLDEAGALRNILRHGSSEGPWREAVATYLHFICYHYKDQDQAHFHSKFIKIVTAMDHDYSYKKGSHICL